MKGRPVTDPALLEKLNQEEETPASGSPVTDPALLAKLNQEEETAPTKQSESFLSQLPWHTRMLANAPIGALDLMGSLRNAPHNIASTLSGHGIISNETAGKFKEYPQTDYGEALGLTNPSDRFMQSLAKNVPAFFIPGAEGAILGPISRILAQSGWGGLTSKDTLKGAENFGIAQGVGEALPFPLKLAGKIAAQFNPVKYTGGKIKEIADFFNNAKKAQKEAYSYMEPYKENWITLDPKNLLDPKDVALFPRSVERRMNNTFYVEPSINNAHRLQSQMGATNNRIKGVDPNSIDVKDALMNSREKLIQMVQSHLGVASKEAGEQYAKGRQITRDILEPTRSTPTLKKITRGTVTDLSPQQLMSTIKKGYETEKIPVNHALMKHLQDLSMRQARAKAFQMIIPTITGATAGAFLPEHMLGGIALGGLGGALGGGAMKYLQPGLIDLAQNPWLLQKLKTLQWPATNAPKAAAGYNMYGQ